VGNGQILVEQGQQVILALIVGVIATMAAVIVQSIE
jgi:hypothetical protein